MFISVYIFNNFFYIYIYIQRHSDIQFIVVRVRELWYLTPLSAMFHFCHGFVNYKKGCTRLAAASDKAYQLLAHGRWFSPGIPASSTTNTGRHDIAEILLKVALNTKNQSINQSNGLKHFRKNYKRYYSMNI